MFQQLFPVGADQLVLAEHVCKDSPVFNQGMIDIADQVIIAGIALVVVGIPAAIITILFV